MDSFELNKIIGALLGTCILLLVTSFAAGAIFSPKMPEKPGFEIAVKEEAGHGGPAEAAAPSEPIEKLLQTASARRAPPPPRSAPPATPSRRAARTVSVQISMASSTTTEAKDA